jgi:hypothetical protein
MSYLLPHLHSGYAVDQAILGEEDRVVVIRFGHDWDPQCMQVSRASWDFGGRVAISISSEQLRPSCLPHQSATQMQLQKLTQGRCGWGKGVGGVEMSISSEQLRSYFRTYSACSRGCSVSVSSSSTCSKARGR